MGLASPPPPALGPLDFYTLTPRYCSDLSSWGPAPGGPSLGASNQHSQTPEADTQLVGREAAGAGPAPFQRQGQCICKLGNSVLPSCPSSGPGQAVLH